MLLFSQKDPLWKNDKLGTCSETIGSAGCKIVCYAMLCEETPAAVNGILKQKNGYTNGCLTVDSLDCQILGLEYKGSVKTDPNTLCIAETNYYKSAGYPQHFFIYSNGMMIDPLELSPSWKANKYKNNMVSYRLISKPNNMDYSTNNAAIIKALEKFMGMDIGNPNDEETKKIVKKLDQISGELKSLQEDVDKASKQAASLEQINSELKLQNQSLKDRIKELETGLKVSQEINEGLEEKLELCQNVDSSEMSDEESQLISQKIIAFLKKLFKING